MAHRHGQLQDRAIRPSQRQTVALSPKQYSPFFAVSMGAHLTSRLGSTGAIQPRWHQSNQVHD